MRDLIPYIFWPWFGISCFILLRRRVTSGGWRPMSEQDTPATIDFPPPPPDPAEVQAVVEPDEPVPTEVPPATPTAESRSDVAVMVPVDANRPRSRSLAEAVEGIAMPCDLAPLIGAGEINPREVAFVTNGQHPATVGSALSDELERLGFAITPLDDRSIRAERGHDVIEARLVSTELTSPDVMRELHPSAPADALVVEMKLT